MRKHHLFILLITLSSQAWASPKEQAWKLHNRIAGVPPVKTAQSDPLKEMEALIAAGRPEDAARIATSNPNFYNVVLKNWIKPWSNREESNRVDLNDFTATVLGIIRDDVPFTEVLSGDILYTVDYEMDNDEIYATNNNEHYHAAEEHENLNLVEKLLRKTQSEMSGLPPEAVSGVLTTRAAGEAFYSAGTNRRVNRYAFVNFLCHDYEELHDVNVPDFRVRRDVERDPGGDSRAYKNQCVGCHAGQDALGGAYAYYDFTGNRLVYTPNRVVTKMNHNVYFQDGFVTKDDSWMNLWAIGQNAKLGWRGPTSGKGVKQLGSMLARSKAFSQCMAKKVFKLVCIKDPVSSEDLAKVSSLASKFESDNYNMKELIIKTSVGCVVNENE